MAGMPFAAALLAPVADATEYRESDYAKGIKVTDAEMAALNIQPADFHGEWNHTAAPRWPDG